MNVPMLMTRPPVAPARFSDWPLALKSIVGFWAFYALTVIARAFLGADPFTVLENKLLVIGVGIVITLAIYVAISTLGEGSSIRRKAAIALVSSMIGALTLGSIGA